MLGKRISRCAPKRYIHPFPHFPNIRYILLPFFFSPPLPSFFSPIKKGEMLGKLGKSVSNSLSPSRLWLPPHFFQCGEVGESWGKLGVCGGEVGSGCGGAAKLGGGVGQKKYPPTSGGDGYFACKGGAKLRRSLQRRGGLGLFRRFLAAILWRSGCGLGCFSYLCAMATLQVGSVAAKAAMRSVPVSGRRKTKAKALQKPKPPVGHE